MLKVIMLVGAPASGKSTWAKQEIAKDPLNWCRISNDDLRNMCNGYVFSAGYEKFITDIRNHLLREALHRNMNVILDNVNSNNKHWETTCKIAVESHKNVQVFEKHFFEELDVLLERNAKREGSARVPDEAVKRFFKELGGTQFKFSNSKNETFFKRNQEVVDAPVWNDSLSTAIISDLDGTLALIHNRNPYDASDCDIKDLPNTPVVKSVQLYHDAGYKIVFCSGREDKFEPETRRFIDKHLPNITYELHMRKTGDFRKDAIIKEEIYRNNIEGKYNVILILDDRGQVVSLWRSLGLTCFQVAPGEF